LRLGFSEPLLLTLDADQLPALPLSVVLQPAGDGQTEAVVVGVVANRLRGESRTLAADNVGGPFED